MAELNNEASGGASKSRKIRSKKLASKVDLTAMVDLAFLLITFFMLTTSLSKANGMKLVMPDQKGLPTKIDENRTMTILIGDDNAQYYMGKLNDETKLQTLKTGELRSELATRKKEVLAYSATKGTPDQGLIVLIKPAKKSNYGNLVDVLDEMGISNVPHYAIVDITEKETALLEKKP